MTTAPAPAPAASATTLSDEHSVLLWQTCSYADDVIDAVRSGRPLTGAHDAMLEFAHYRLMPYLGEEERQLSPTQLSDGHLVKLLLDDHGRLRSDVEQLEASRTRRLLGSAAGRLVERLDRHMRREETWLPDASGDPAQADVHEWALPLLISDVIDVDSLPADHRDALIRQRLGWMRPGDTVWLQAGRDLHPLWARQHVIDHGAHAWVYEEAGPSRWRVRISRRPTDV